MLDTKIFHEEQKNVEPTKDHIIPDKDFEKITDEGLKEIDQSYRFADALSMKHAKNHLKSLLVMAVAGAVIAITFLLYDEAEWHFLIWPCLILILILVMYLQSEKRLNDHERYLEYRIVAEALRVHFFLSIAKVETRVIDIIPWYITASIPWIKDVFAELPPVNVTRKTEIIDYWVLSQKSYHERAIGKAKKKKATYDRLENLTLAITIITYLATLGFEVFVLLNMTGNVDVDFIRSILKILLGSAAAVTILIGNYFGKLSLDEIIDGHERMRDLYVKIEHEIAVEGENDRIIVYLAREFLIENATWYVYESKNKPELII